MFQFIIWMILKKVVEEEGIEVAILTIPAQVAQPVTDRLLEAKIRAILNFTPARLTVPDHVRVHHIDLAVELQALVYFLKHYSPDEVDGR